MSYGRQAFAFFQQAGNRHGQAAALDTIGSAYRGLGCHHKAVRCYLRALELYGSAGDPYSEPEVFTHIGDSCHATGDHAAARKWWEQAKSILDKLDHPDAASVRAKLAGLTSANPDTGGEPPPPGRPDGED